MRTRQSKAFNALQPYADPRYWGWDGVGDPRTWIAAVPIERTVPEGRVTRGMRRQVYAGLTGYLAALETYAPSAKLACNAVFDAARFAAGTIVLAKTERINYGARTDVQQFLGSGPVIDRDTVVAPLFGLIEGGTAWRKWDGVAYRKQTVWGVVVSSKESDNLLLTVPAALVESNSRVRGVPSHSLPASFTVGQSFRPARSSVLYRVTAMDVCGQGPGRGESTSVFSRLLARLALAASPNPVAEA